MRMDSEDASILLGDNFFVDDFKVVEILERHEELVDHVDVPLAPFERELHDYQYDEGKEEVEVQREDGVGQDENRHVESELGACEQENGSQPLVPPEKPFFFGLIDHQHQPIQYYVIQQNQDLDYMDWEVFWPWDTSVRGRGQSKKARIVMQRDSVQARSGQVSSILNMTDSQRSYNNFMNTSAQYSLDFMRVAMGEPKQEDDDFSDFESEGATKLATTSSPMKKNFKLHSFLAKFTEEQFQTIVQYTVEHKALLNQPPPIKISTFQDALFLREFLKARDRLITDRVRTLDALCIQLQLLTKRAKTTIRERVCKKLANVPVEEIMQALQTDNPIDVRTAKEKQKSKNIPPPAHRDMGNLQESIKQEVKKTRIKAGQINQYVRVKEENNSIEKNRQARYYQQPTPQQSLNSPSRERRDFIIKQQNRSETQYGSPGRMSVKTQKQDSLEMRKRSLTKIEKTREQLQEFDRLYKFNFIEQRYEEALKNPSLKNQYMWEKQEDLLLHHFSMKPEANSEAMRQLISKKSKQMVLERAEFLSVQWKANSVAILDRLSKELEPFQASPTKDFQEKGDWGSQEDMVLLYFNMDPEEKVNEMLCLLRYKCKKTILERIEALRLKLNAKAMSVLDKISTKRSESILSQPGQWEF